MKAGCFGRWNTDDFQSVSHFGAEQIDKLGGGRSGTEAEPHAIFDVVQGMLGCLPFPVVAAHHCPS